MTHSNAPTKGKHTKLILGLMILIVVGPFLFAWVMLQKGNLQQLRTSNHGDLIIPPPSISTTTLYDLNISQAYPGSKLEGKWWLVYVGPNKCHQECQNTFYNMRQVRTALGKNANRVERLFIPHPNCPQDVCELYLNEYYPDMARAKIDPADFKKTFGTISQPLEREIVGELYLIDPNGNIMMHYAADNEPKEILSDMKRLLKVSKIG